MKIVLTLIDDPSVEPIVIEDDVFSVGRRETPFDSQPVEKAERLSRRHARLFFEDGMPYVADLGSTNGTLHNHVLLNNQAAQLADGDELNFAGEFRFKVKVERDIADDRTVVAMAPPVELRLVPSKPEGILPIIVKGFPFLITRNDPAFEAGDAQEVGQISRKHAVIMLKRGVPFIEDLESANGSFVNGRRLDERVMQLNGGDVLSLGSGVEFTVFVDEVDDGRTIVAPPATQSASGVTAADDQPIASEPEPDRQPEPARVATQPDEAPGRKAEPQASAPNAVEAEVPPAEVVETEPDDPAPDSSAGLASLAAELPASEEVAAAEEAEAPPEHGPASSAVAATPEERPAAPVSADTSDLLGTRIVGSGDSFLKLLYEKEEEDDVQEAAPRINEGPRNKAAAFGQALGGRSAISARVLWSIAAAVGLVAGVWGYVYWSESAERGLRACLESGQYLTCAQDAADQLATGSTNREVERLGEQALIRGLIDTWKPELEAGNFSGAQAQLTQAAGRFAVLPGTKDIVGVLEWITRTTRYRNHNSDVAASWFQADDQDVGEVVAAWSANEAVYSRVMVQMAEYSPDFRQIQTQAMSDLRALRETDSVYGKALSAAKESLYRKLETGAVGEARAEAEAFRQQYTQVLGTAALLSGLDQFEAVVAAYEARDLMAVSARYAALDVQVPVVRRGLEAWYERFGPRESVVATYQAAAAAWRAGDAEQSITRLGEITDGIWAEVAADEVARQQQVAADYANLRAMDGSADYKLALLEFAAGLTAEDAYYSEALAEPLAGYSAEIGGEVAAQFERATAFWDSYRDDGGISGIMRVESNVSRSYARQAERLRDAYALVMRALVLAEATATRLTDSQTRIAEDVRSEAARQHRWLSDLSAVLPPATLAEKRAALPELQEDET